MRAEESHMMSYIPTESEIRLALSRDGFYAQLPLRIVVPDGYDGPTVIDGIDVETRNVDEPYIIRLGGGRVGFNGCELASGRDTEWLARTIREQVFTSIPGILKRE